MRAFVAILLVAVATAELAPLHENSEPIKGKYIIKLKDEYNVDEIAATVRLSGGRVESIYRYVINAFAADLSDSVLDVVRSLPAVEYVEQDGIYRALIGEGVTWGLDRIDQEDLPLSDSYNPTTGNGGASVTAWVIDTGVRASHNDFGRRARQVVNFAGGDNEDCNGHGTHCAGTVGSTTYGVASEVSIKGVKVLGCLGSGSGQGVLNGVDYVRQQAGNKDVASMSLGGGLSPSLDTAVTNLVNSGVPVAVAAGNDNRDACNYSPARAAAAVTVGATAKSDKRSSFSNYGKCLDIFAPGTNIKSLGHRNDDATTTMSGTSMACPHVAGAIALYGEEALTMARGAADMVREASTGKVTNAGTLSPNKLLYV